MKTFTDAQITNWKKIHGEIFEISVQMDEEGKDFALCIVKKPGLDLITSANHIHEEAPSKAGMMIFDNCFIDGDERLKTDEEARLGAALKVVALFKTKVATIKKL